METTTNISEIKVLLDGKQAEQAIEGLKAKISLLKKEKEDLSAKPLLSPDEVTRMKDIEREIRQATSGINEMKKQSRDVGEVMQNIANISEKELGNAIRILISQTKKLDHSTQEYADNRKKIALMRKEMEKINSTGKKQVSMFDQMGATIKRLAAYVLVYAGFNELTQGLRKMVEVNARLSDQMADIEKTTGITGRALRELGEDIRKIDTRTAVEDLNKLAYAAGKIGISGKENVLQFVGAANQIKVALGEDLGEDAIQNIAKLNDVLGITKALGVEKSLLSTGSAINELGQSSTASEGYLVDFSQRLGGIAAQAGITVQQILALASASDQTGQNVEVAATAINKLITTIISKTDQVAKAIGITTNELNNALGKSTWEGLMLVFDKLKGKGGLAGLAPIMGDLGSDGARLTAVIAALTSNTDMLTTALGTSNKAFEEATSLTAETTKKEESLNGIWARSMKNLEAHFANSAITDRLKDIAVYVYRVTGSFDDMGNRIGGAVNLLATLVEWLLKLSVFLLRNIDILAAFAAGFAVVRTAMAASMLVAKAYAAVMKVWAIAVQTARAVSLVFALGIAKLTGNVTRAAAAMKMLTAITIINPFVAAAVAIAAVGAALYAVYTRATEASREMANFRKEMNESISAEKAESEYLFAAAQKAAQGSEERKKAIEELNSKYSEYLPNLLTETTSNKELADALKKVNIALQESIVLRMKREDAEKLMRESMTSQLNYMDNIRAESKATEEMNERMLTRAKELTEANAVSGSNASETFSAVQRQLMIEFGKSAKQSGSYWEEVNNYILETISLRDKLAANEKKYALFMPKKQKEKNEPTMLGEVVVSAPLITTKTASEDEGTKRREAEEKAIELWLQKKKNALTEARLATASYNDEERVSQDEQNRAMEALEMEALRRRLQIKGLEPLEIEKIEGQILDIRQKLLDETESETAKYLDNLDKMYEQFELKAASKDQRELIRIQQKYNDATKLLKDALDKRLISEEEYAAQVEALRVAEGEAEKEYFRNKASKDANAELDRLDKSQAEEELAAAEMRVNGLFSEQEYKNKLIEIEMAYQEKRLQIAGLTEEQITNLKRNNADRQIHILDEQSRKQESIQKKYASIIESSLTDMGGAFGALMSGEEDAMQAFGTSMIDIMANVLTQMVPLWVAQLAGTATVTTAKATAESLATPDSALTFGASGMARAAIITGLITAAIAAATVGLKAMIGGSKPSAASGSTGNRVVKKGYRTGGHVVGGGYTGPGNPYEPAGIVHRDEYVVPAWQKDPVSFSCINVLESIRAGRAQASSPSPLPGYAAGGSVEAPRPAMVDAPDNTRLNETLQGIEGLLSDLRQKGVYTNLNISNLNREQTRYSASVARGSRK